MEGKVIKPFIDKNTLKGYSVGKVFKSDDSERFAFLQKEGYLEVKEPSEKPKPKRTRKQKAGE
jgi:hypothetical protein